MRHLAILNIYASSLETFAKMHLKMSFAVHIFAYIIDPDQAAPVEQIAPTGAVRSMSTLLKMKHLL